LPKKFGVIDRFNHEYPVNNIPQNFCTTLEIGAGTGEHLRYEKLSEEQKENYYAVDIRQNMVNELKLHFPEVNSFVGDCQKKLDFEDGFFDRILAIHVLEHLPNLPEAIREMHRLLNKENGFLQIVIPCEGSMAYTLARRLSAQRIFEARYKQSYQWFIEREHINLPNEIFEELSPYFRFTSKQFFPFPLNLEFCNLVIGGVLRPIN
jgi:ubiquinone/menaquinone biosynthesis C-methylase UbiE